MRFIRKINILILGIIEVVDSWIIWVVKPHNMVQGLGSGQLRRWILKQSRKTSHLLFEEMTLNKLCTEMVAMLTVIRYLIECHEEDRAVFKTAMTNSASELREKAAMLICFSLAFACLLVIANHFGTSLCCNARRSLASSSSSTNCAAATNRNDASPIWRRS